MTDLFTWGNIITAMAALVAFGMGAIVVPKQPWYREAQVAFLGVAIVAYVKILLWGFTSHHDAGWRVAWTIAGLLIVSAFAGALIWRVQRHIHEDRQPSESALVECPAKWAHEIVDTQDRELLSRIKLEGLEFRRIELYREKPFIEFSFRILNQSIYTVFLTELGGTIDYGGEALASAVQSTANDPITLNPLKPGDVVVKLILNDSDDVKRIKNIDGTFTFSNLKAKLHTNPTTTVREFAFPGSLTSEEIRQQFPKMMIEMVGRPRAETAPLGTCINVHVILKNPRPKALALETFRFRTPSPEQRLTGATLGDIGHEPNLANETVIASQNVPIDGWLQFRLDGVDLNSLGAPRATLIIIDKSEEEHRKDCHL